MNSFIVLMNKEFTQMVRDFKIIWLPLVFILLGITQPVMTYYLPTILEALGSGQGITIDPNIAAQQGGEILAGTLGAQFDQLGIIIIAISLMGIIQTDKANGMLAFILTRPVPVRSYVGGKIASNYIFTAFSVAVGYLASYLYVNLLFTNVAIFDMLTALLFYLVWILFIISFTTMISTLINSPGLIALISIAFLIGCRLIVGLSSMIDIINPASMSKHAMEVLITGSVNSNAIVNLVVSLLCAAIAIFITNYWISNKKFSNE
ncbi:ABC transporter permease [Psychrobacillus psychrodurans]|uniref:ABC transporter permease n=1 Tax=Psychrobacillus psychrodurans TaxID=126157 RepID=UPI0008E06C3C|nr:ABC transporter permease subunit [Psychrobacillus psychrodurans]MCZ8541410.1 ABC-2 transporter permease [Psychrobacillus psychrodurans]SFM98123.1 ABC-2 type transport system permease protein [Psychrobacillus psychrodurans]